jgi:mandelate racemase
VALRVTGVVARPVVAPLRRPLRVSAGAVTQAPLLLVDLQTDGGITGRAYLIAYHAFALDPLRGLVTALGEMVRGDPLAPFDLERKLRARLTLLGPHNLTGLALAGLDMAAWDALAVAQGLPLATLLGGRPRPVPAYNSNGLGIMPPGEAAAEAEELLAEGFRAVKIRLGRPTLEEDLAAVRAVRARIGGDVVLMSDFNQALSVNEAIRRGQALDAEGLYWIEEPVRQDDHAGCARVAAALRTPVQIGENFSGPLDMQAALQARAADFVMPDVQRIGGVTGWMRAAALAHGAGLECSSHLFPEVSAHLLAVTPTAHWLEYMDWADPILVDPPRVTAGTLTASARPGIGLTWDEDAVARYLVR